jgi:ubiquinone biosynthesis protein
LIWNTFFDETTLATILPSEHAVFARPVKEAFVVFLSGLPTPVQDSILREQSTLPVGASISQRLGLLARHCPVLHKLGQLLARDERLAEELRAELRPLESLPPSMRIETVQSTLVREFGRLESRAIALLGPPISEASVAVVVPYRDTASGSARDGVLKVLKPGIEERLELELNLLRAVGSHLDDKCVELSIPQLDYKDTFEQVGDKLRWEVRLDQEQQHLREAADTYKQNVAVQIPTLFDQCTARVTAMERVFGVKVTDHGLDLAVDRLRLADLVSRVLVAQPVLSRDKHAAFHGDPHAGNLLYTKDGRLAILDWSLVGHLTEFERVVMAQIVLSAITLDASRIVRLLCELNTQTQVKHSTLRAVVEKWLRRVRCGQFPGIIWLVGMLDEATLSSQLRMRSDLMIFRKSLHTLEGVLRDLGADGAEMEWTFLRESILQFGKELPERLFSQPTSRVFGTRVSSADISAAIVDLPLTVRRYWQGWWLDLLCRVPA